MIDIDKAMEYEKMLREKQKIIDETIDYIEKMSYADIVDNPKKDLIKILKKEK
ncbi:MAG: hypothetical protein J6S85_04475 [Methanobrevibacter sp.]|nr:hypothetical protein [Methanobrevibacter sp.]MBO7712801.1 hypothetical protein [Methanobrevibacter sp.]